MIISPSPAKVFFHALDYPEFARPNFFIINQKESGWSRGVYLTFLSEVYHACMMAFRIKYGLRKKNNPELKLEELTLPLSEFNFLDDSFKENNRTINKEILDDLHIAVLASSSFGEKQPIYTPYEILFMVEYALWFIKKEFQIQTKEINYPYFRPRTKTYFIYHIAQDGPFFDFPKFKSAIQELILTTPNFLVLKQKLTLFYNAAKEIVDLYNNKIYSIEDTANKSGESKAAEIVSVEFKASSLSHSWWNDKKIFDVKNPKPFLNQDLAIYASQIANLLTDTVLTKTKKELKAREKDFLGDLLFGIQHYQETNYRGWKKPIKENPNLEWPYRDWFHNWFEAKGYNAEKEPLKGAGHIDLKVSHGSIGKRKVEFKGWWNRKKNDLVQQVFRYLTEFDVSGYIVLINTSGQNIVEEYQSMISQQKEFKTYDWKEKTFYPSAYKYYKSTHEINGMTKSIFHFIINGTRPSLKRKAKPSAKDGRSISRQKSIRN